MQFDPFKDFDNEVFSVFMLNKTVFIVDGVTAPPSKRCDHASIAGMLPTYGTAYQDEATYLGQKSPYGHNALLPRNVNNFRVLIDFIPDFRIYYFEIVNINSAGQPVHNVVSDKSEFSWWNDPVPSGTWVGFSFVELLKIMREWSFMVEDPFNVDHPMAVLSKKFFEVLKAPQDVLNEIDALPDSYLAKFLKGDPNFREKNPNFPSIPTRTKLWLQEKMLEYPEKQMHEYIEAL